VTAWRYDFPSFEFFATGHFLPRVALRMTIQKASGREWSERNEDAMNENDPQMTSISKANNLQDVAEFWDTHSLTDFEDQIEEVDFEVRARRRRRITLEPEVYDLVSIQARVRGVAPETLVNVWIVERLREAA
jgi:hypothetical protein